MLFRSAGGVQGRQLAVAVPGGQLRRHAEAGQHSQRPDADRSDGGLGHVGGAQGAFLRVALGLALRGIANSAIDISDGLLADLGHILERSDCAAEIEFEDLPASPLLSRHLESAAALRALLAGGDDYELCFTAPVRNRARVLAAAKRAGVRVTPVGHIKRPARGVPRLLVHAPDGTPLRLKGGGGFDHFEIGRAHV